MPTPKRKLHPHRRFAMNTITAHRRAGYEVTFRPMELVSKMVAEGATHCPLCGVEYIWEGAIRVRRNSPSLDRLEHKSHTRVLTLLNVRLLCHWCNLAKGELTDEEFISRCKNIVDRKAA